MYCLYRKLYVGDQGSHKVMQCDLDGKNCVVVQSIDSGFFFWPNQITINFVDKYVILWW